MRVLVTGASGFLGGFLVAHLRSRGHEVVGLGGERLPAGCDQAFAIDLGSGPLPEPVARGSFDGVAHLAAIADPRACEAAPARAHAVNVGGTRSVAELAARTGARFVSISSDVVFDGVAPPPGGYGPDSPPSPVTAYGRTKVAAETVARELAPWAAVVRPSLLYRRRYEGTTPAPGEWIVAEVARGGRPTAYTDQVRHPIHAADLAALVAALLESRRAGTFHAGCRRPWRRYDFTCLLVRHFGGAPEQVQAATTAERPPGGGLVPQRDLTLDVSSSSAVLGHAPHEPDEVLLAQHTTPRLPTTHEAS